MKLLESKCILGGQGGRMQAEAEVVGLGAAWNGQGGRMQVEGEDGGTCAARNGLPMEGSEVGKEIVILLKILCSVSACMLFVMVLNLLLVLMK